MTNNTSTTSSVLPSTLETLSWIIKKEAEKSKPAIPLQTDTLSKGKKKAETSITLATDRVQLPPSTSLKNSGITFDLKEIADFFAEFYNMGAKTAQSQTTDFSNLITLDQSINAAQMETADKAIEKQKNAIKQATDLKEQQAQIEKVSKVLKWVMIGVMIASVVILVVAAVCTFGAALIAAPEVIGAEVAIEGGVEGVVEVIDMSVMSTTEVGVEAGTETVGEAGTAALEEGTFEMTEMGAEATTETGVESTSSTTSQTVTAAMKKIAQILANKVFKALIGLAASGTTASYMGYQSYAGFKNAASLSEIAESQKVVGDAVAMMKYTSQISQYFQKLTQRTADTLSNTSKMINVAPETFGQICQVLQQITGQASQAAIKG